LELIPELLKILKIPALEPPNRFSLFQRNVPELDVFLLYASGHSIPGNHVPDQNFLPDLFLAKVFYVEGIVWTQVWYFMDFGLRKRKEKVTARTDMEFTDKYQSPYL
jgi:hypothetical protein